MNYQSIILFFLFVVSHLAFAAEKEKTCNEADWNCHGSFYVTGGYVFVHTLFQDNILSITPPDQTMINFSPQSSFPNNASGMRFGFSSGFGLNLPLSYELDYNQVFTHSQINNDLKISRASKAIVGTLAYTVNPKSRLRLSLVAGASVISTYLTATTVSPRPFFSQNTNSVDVDPFFGGSFSYQINSKFAMRVVEFYDMATYNRGADGALVTLVMLNYYPG